MGAGVWRFVEGIAIGITALRLTIVWAPIVGLADLTNAIAAEPAILMADDPAAARVSCLLGRGTNPVAADRAIVGGVNAEEQREHSA